MRALLLHASEFKVNIIDKSNKPYGIKPETKKSSTENMTECLVVFFCVEKNDNSQQIQALFKEIVKITKELSTTSIMVAPFVHLSSNIAEPEKAKKLYFSLLKKLKNTYFKVSSSHFGYHKSLLLDIKGHPGSFRYREF
jgi:threonyl-tRNA synthetase